MVAASMTTNAPQPGVLRYTAFSSVPDGGSPAGVVLDAAALDDSDMLAIAADLGYSESAFLTGPGEAGVRHARRHRAGGGDRGGRDGQGHPQALKIFQGQLCVAKRLSSRLLGRVLRRKRGADGLNSVLFLGAPVELVHVVVDIGGLPQSSSEGVRAVRGPGSTHCSTESCRSLTRHSNGPPWTRSDVRRWHGASSVGRRPVLRLTSSERASRRGCKPVRRRTMGGCCPTAGSDS